MIIEISNINQYTVIIKKNHLKHLPPKQIITKISNHFKTNPKTIFLIDNAKNIPYNKIIKTLNLLHNTNIKSINLITQPI